MGYGNSGTSTFYQPKSSSKKKVSLMEQKLLDSQKSLQANKLRLHITIEKLDMDSGKKGRWK